MIIACVRTGTRYGPEYVERLRNMVARHLPLEHRVVCLTDQPERIEGVECIEVHGLPRWWAKMALFGPEIRGNDRTLFFDLDTVIVGDLTPLAEWDGTFGICANFTWLSGHPDWPCRYGSCVMSLAPGFGDHIWRAFWAERERWMAECPRGDQQAIEQIYPHATLLQDVMPEGYFVGRREFTERKPDGAAVMVFAGRAKPHNTPYQWLKEAWA